MFRQQDFGRKEKAMLFRKMEKLRPFERIAFESGLVLSAVEREAMEKIDFSEVEVRAIFAWEWKKEELRREAFERKNDNRIMKAKRDDLDSKLDKLY